MEEEDNYDKQKELRNKQFAETKDFTEENGISHSP